MLTHVPHIDMTDLTGFSGVTLAVSIPAMDWMGTTAQAIGTVLGLILLYWSIRKRRAEALKIEKENEKKSSHDDK